MPTLVALPAELIHSIFNGLDQFHDLISLASTCRYINQVWLSGAPDLIWRVGSATIIAFDEALIAVRATQVVIDAQYSHKEPPSPFPSLWDMSGARKPPLLSEVRILFDFRHLILCIENQMTEWEYAEMGRTEYHRPRPTIYYHWRKQLHQGLYLCLIAGAYCFRAYNGPFFEAREVGTVGEYFLEYYRTGRFPMSARGEEMFEDYPVYLYDYQDDHELGIWRDEMCGDEFGDLAKWIMDKGKQRSIEDERKPVTFQPRDAHQNEDLSFDSAQVGALIELKCLIHGYEHMHRKIHVIVDDRPVEAEEDRAEFNHPPFPKYSRGLRTVRAIPFGHFQLLTIDMPNNIKDAGKNSLAASVISTPSVASISDVLHTVRKWHYQDNNAAPPPEYLFFTWMLRRFFDLKTHHDCFLTFLGSDWSCQRLSDGDIFLAPCADVKWVTSFERYRLPIMSNHF